MNAAGSPASSFPSSNMTAATFGGGRGVSVIGFSAARISSDSLIFFGMRWSSTDSEWYHVHRTGFAGARTYGTTNSSSSVVGFPRASTVLSTARRRRRLMAVLPVVAQSGTSWSGRR